MVNYMLPRFGIKPVKVFLCEGAQQQLRLIKPGGIRWRIEHMAARVRGKVTQGIMSDMGRPVVNDDMDAASVQVTPFDLPHAPEEVLVVIGLHAVEHHAHCYRIPKRW